MNYNPGIKVSKGCGNPGTFADLLTAEELRNLKNNSMQEIEKVKLEMLDNLRAMMYGFFWRTRSRGYNHGY
jgi:hypothetical protein